MLLKDPNKIKTAVCNFFVDRINNLLIMQKVFINLEELFHLLVTRARFLLIALFVVI